MPETEHCIHFWFRRRTYILSSRGYSLAILVLIQSLLEELFDSKVFLPVAKVWQHDNSLHDFNLAELIRIHSRSFHFFPVSFDLYFGNLISSSVLQVILNSVPISV